LEEEDEDLEEREMTVGMSVLWRDGILVVVGEFLRMDLWRGAVVTVMVKGAKGVVGMVKQWSRSLWCAGVEDSGRGGQVQLGRGWKLLSALVCSGQTVETRVDSRRVRIYV
jgi:hypothetical protein